MPGCGKTTVGRMLAEGLNYRWMDVDQFIEKVGERERVFYCDTNNKSLSTNPAQSHLMVSTDVIIVS